MKRTTAVMGVLLLAASGWADVPGPDGKRGQPPPLVLPPKLTAEGKRLVVVDQDAYWRGHLRIPRKLLAGAEAPAIPDVPMTGSAPSRTIVAGVALSAAVIAGGLWLRRFRKHQLHIGKVALTMAASVLVLGCGLWPWVIPDSPPTPVPIPGALCSGPFVIEVVDGDAIEVLLTKDMVAKIREELKK